MEEGKQVGPVHARATAEPEAPPPREPWSQTDARIVHGIDLTWRLFLAAIAGLFGSLLLYMPLAITHAAVRKSLDAKDGADSWSTLVLLPVACTMIAFAYGQVLQVWEVGGDQAFDQRLWARLSGEERAAWRLQMRRKGWRTFRAWTGLNVAAFCIFGSRFHVELAGRPQALGVVAAIAVFAALTLYGYFRPMPRMREDSDASVSQGRWTVIGEWADTRSAVFAFMAAAALFGAAVWLFTIRAGRIDVFTAGLLGALILWEGIRDLREARRTRGMRRPELDIVRAGERPLVLACVVRFPGPLKDRNVRAPVVARFRAIEVYNKGQRSSRPWAEVSAPVQVSHDGLEGRFQLALGTADMMPYALSVWEITIERGGRRNRLVFSVPNEVIFPESYPAA
jgi:hypothetical protein